MAKQTDGINGGYRGTVGTVIGYMWRGQWCLRAKPRAYHDAQTEVQLAQRALFKATVAFAGRVKEVLRKGLNVPAYEAHKTECNYFLKLNKACFAMDGEALVVDYPSLRVSEGPVAPVEFLPTPAFGHPSYKEGMAGAALPLPGRGARRAGWVDPEETTITLPFDKNPANRRANMSDLVYVAAFCDGRAELSAPAYRRMGSVTLMLPEGWAGKEVHLFGFVVDAAGRASDSHYIGEWNELCAREASDGTEIPGEEPSAIPEQSVDEIVGIETEDVSQPGRAASGDG